MNKSVLDLQACSEESELLQSLYKKEGKKENKKEANLNSSLVQRRFYKGTFHTAHKIL